MGQLELPGIGQSGRSGPGLQYQAMRTIGREVARDDREGGAPTAGHPGRILFKGRAPGAQNAMRPFQVRRPNPAALVVQKRDLEVHRDRNLPLEGPRIAATSVPGDRISSSNDRLLFLGNELIEKPKPRERSPRGMLERVCRVRAENAQ